VDSFLLTLTDYSFRLDLDMAKKKIEKSVSRYGQPGGSAGNVNSTMNDADITPTQDRAEYIPESEESDEDDYDDDIQVKERKQRQGVSAEVYGEHNKKEDYVPRVIEKT